MSLELSRTECEQLEREGKYRRAATQWLELSDRFELAGLRTEAAMCALRAAACCGALVTRFAKGDR